MGFDPELFLSPVDDELKCPICYRVLEEPLQGYKCDHIFCGACIDLWLLNSNVCPMDRLPLERGQLRPVSKMVTNLLHRLEVKCPYEKYGCSLTLPLGSLDVHSSNCRCKYEVNDNLNLPARNVNPLSLIREMAVSTNDLRNLKQSVTHIGDQLLQYKCEEQEMSNVINDFSFKLDECHNMISGICDPLFALILGTDYCDGGDGDRQTIAYIDINIQNLSEFTNEGLLYEYLRQNDIYAKNIQRSKTHFARSLNFIVTIAMNEKCKILDSKLWPIGVSAFVRGEKLSAVNGTRSKYEPACVTIKAGITCWSGNDYFN